LGFLRTLYDRKEPSCAWVVGVPGVGKTETVRRASADFHHLYHRAPPLSDPQQRAALARTLRDSGFMGGEELQEEPLSWDALFQALVEGSPEGRSTVLVVDDAHRWVESRARFDAALRNALARGRASGKGIHVTLIAPEPGPAMGGGEHPVAPLSLRPLSFRAAAPLLPGIDPRERLRAYAVFGGLPGVLTLLDPDATLDANLLHLVLARDAPLRDAPLDLLERQVQKPTRYAAILAALAHGEGDWGLVQAGVGDLTSSGQAGPYLKRLEALNLVEARRSLDAPPRSRSRRYRITDPFLAFWFRFVLPCREALAGGHAEGACMEVVGAGLESHLASVLPEVCRDYMSLEAVEVFGSNARECGSLWGQGYDMPVAGILGGGTPFYGHVLREGGGGGPSPFAILDRQVRETRYGFGRERRLRVLFLEGEAQASLHREVARRDDAALVGLDTLAGL